MESEPQIRLACPFSFPARAVGGKLNCRIVDVVDGLDHHGTNQRNVPKMLQSMLQDRFGMKAHREKREFSVYNLVLSKRVPIG